MYLEFPVKDHQISQKFGNDVTNDPVKSRFYELFDNKHCGVDFPVSVGTDVFSSFPGIVVRQENHVGMGNIVGVRNGNIVALYAHLNSTSVNLGDIIPSGRLLGKSGWTGGACDTPHLHFEVRDITRATLKEMVFDPPFGKEVIQYSPTFVYTVNNQNTTKTPKKLGSLYFGSETMGKLIKEANNLQIGDDEVLAEGEKIIIPNFV